MFVSGPTGHRALPLRSLRWRTEGPRASPPPHPSCALGPNSAVTALPSCFPRLPPSSCPWPFKRFFLNRPGLEQRKRCKVSAGSGSEKSEAQGAAWGGKEAPAGTRQSRDPGRGVRLGLRAPGRRRGAPGARSTARMGRRESPEGHPTPEDCRRPCHTHTHARLPGPNQPPALCLLLL